MTSGALCQVQLGVVCNSLVVVKSLLKRNARKKGERGGVQLRIREVIRRRILSLLPGAQRDHGAGLDWCKDNFNNVKCTQNKRSDY